MQTVQDVVILNIEILATYYYQNHKRLNDNKVSVREDLETKTRYGNLTIDGNVVRPTVTYGCVLCVTNNKKRV